VIKSRLQLITAVIASLSSILFATDKHKYFFPLRVPPGYQNRINTNNPEDPFHKQVLPSVEVERVKPDKIIIPF